MSDDDLIPPEPMYPDMPDASIVMRRTNNGVVPGAAWVCPLGILALTVPWYGEVGPSIVHTTVGLAAWIGDPHLVERIEDERAYVLRAWRRAVLFERFPPWVGATYEELIGHSAAFRGEWERIMALSDADLEGEVRNAE